MLTSIFIVVIATIIFSFNFNATTIPTRAFNIITLQPSVYSPPTTTISPNSGWVNPSTTFTLSIAGSSSSTAWTDGSQKNDMDFAGGTAGNDVATITNWTDASTGGCYVHLVTWPQTNSWSNYSGVNTGSGYNKIGAEVYDQDLTHACAAYYTIPGYMPTGNQWVYFSAEIQPGNCNSGQQYYFGTSNLAENTWGIQISFGSNGSITFEARGSISTGSSTSCVSWTAGGDYFIRVYFNPSTFKSYWALNGTKYTNGGNYWGAGILL